MNLVSMLTTMLTQFILGEQATSPHGYLRKRSVDTTLWDTEYRNLVAASSPDQADALLKLFFKPYDAFVLVGKGGAGKSRTINLFADIAKAYLDADVIKVAPVGISAQNIGGRTMHSMFGMGIHHVLPRLPQAVASLPGANNWYMLQKKPQYESFRQLVTVCKKHAESNLRLNATYQDLIIIVDEFEFATSEQLVAMYHIAKLCKPNGNVRVILVGDPLQPLPKGVSVSDEGKVNKHTRPWKPARFVYSVNERNQQTVYHYGSLMEPGHEGGGPYCLDFPQDRQKALLWQVEKHVLTTCHRQGDELEFIKELDKVRFGIKLNTSSIITRAMTTVEPKNYDGVVMVPSNATARAINEKHYEEVKNDGAAYAEYNAFIAAEDYFGRFFEGRILDWNTETKELTVRLKGREKTQVYQMMKPEWVKPNSKHWLDELTSEPVTKIAVGMKFLCRQNIDNLGVTNGTRGTVIALGRDTITIQDDKSGRIIHLGYVDNPGVPCDIDGNAKAIFRQLPGHAGYAVTIAKTLGLTLDKAMLRLEPWMCTPKAGSGWYEAGTYMALSRVSSLNGLTIYIPMPIGEEDRFAWALQRFNQSIKYDKQSYDYFMGFVKDSTGEAQTVTDQWYTEGRVVYQETNHNISKFLAYTLNEYDQPCEVIFNLHFDNKGEVYQVDSVYQGQTITLSGDQVQEFGWLEDCLNAMPKK